MQRKVFRIESMMSGRRPAVASARAAEPCRKTTGAPHVNGDAREGYGTDGLQNLKAELARVHDTIAHNMRDLNGLIGDGKERRMARAADELGAAVDGMETATEKILKSAEIIDDSARALTASLQDEFKRGLAQEIQDHVTRVYESCNFQDLAGQRIGKVIATLTAIEEQVAAMLARCNGIDGLAPATALPRGGLLNGPKLDGDPGHATQHDIDKMFG